MTNEDAQQDVWITLRLKGSCPLATDAHDMAADLVKRIEAYLDRSAETQPPSRWLRVLRLRPHTLEFTLTEAAELIEVEEEADIYDTREAVS